ncbi:hypothetical protein GGQ97_000993 [Sphingomonas kaistensis]|uniref:PilZ domain-containing protein n=1 Tax=Sphingomonas kaistensis TaxID=298708 RepID=A0A7X5Y798_9SPHN|nr:PilZ domain-containing protein [Sphingomonas kaistensis]NJC05200.1 hypothetical protein [Sphingomonas kaistensis]
MFMEKLTRDCHGVEEAAGLGDDEGNGFRPRRFERQDVRCPVRVRIGNRQYAAYLDNASDGGVKVSTGSRIVPAGKVIVQIPDLPPLRGELRWASEREAGVAFPLVDGYSPITDWLARRASSDAGRDQD